MSDHTNDQTSVRWPDENKDAFNVVLQDGPDDLDSLCPSFMSKDEFTDSMYSLWDSGYVKEVEGDLEKYGTTSAVYYVPKSLEDTDA